MKRSYINTALQDAVAAFARAGILLPPFARWTPGEWRLRGPEADEIRDTNLGWDITDFGSGDFERCGLLLFTLRNGSHAAPDAYPKRYAEKVMLVREHQVTPLHFHWKKREDIINRGGGTLVIELFRAAEDETLADEPFTVQVDGITRRCAPGESIKLAPGMSICLEPYVYHTFYALNAPVVAGEVSDVNDDANDNRFLEPAGRFPAVEEDEPARFLLCTEYTTNK